MLKRMLSNSLLILVFLQLFVRISSGQNSKDLSQFYIEEQKNWIEYISRAKAIQADTTFDVQFYHLNISLDPSTHLISGSVLCRFKSKVQNLSSIKLDLHSAFTIESISGISSSYSFIDDLITIQLSQTLQPEELGEVEIFYSGIPELYGNLKGVRFETHGNNEPVIATLSTPFLAHYWWPCKDGPGDKPDSVYIDISIPDTIINGTPLMAVSNGVLESVSENGSLKTFHWRERYPIVPYYVMMAISNYTHFQQNYSGTSGEAFPIDYYVFNESISNSQVGVAQLPDVIAAFSEMFGPYPFANEKYGMTELGFYGAIENQTNTIQNTLNISWFETTVHELAHMWFGDMITCKTWNHCWLNEGFATYCESLWKEKSEGFEAYKTSIANNKFFSAGTLYLADDTDPLDVFIPIVYKKGAYVLHMLRGVLGDEVFFDALKEYCSNPDFRYNHATTEDFQLVCENVSGKDLAYFFDQWVYDRYYPRYKVEYYKSNNDFDINLNITQTQSIYGWREVFIMPIQLKINYVDGTDSLVTILNDNQVQSYQIKHSKQIDNFDFDPDEWILNHTMILTDVDDSLNNLISLEYSLTQNYPNPFNPTTTIEYSIKQSENVNLTIYNSLGEQVTILVNAYKPAGSHKIVLNTKDLSSGIYFYTIRAGSFIQTKKMILLK